MLTCTNSLGFLRNMTYFHWVFQSDHSFPSCFEPGYVVSQPFTIIFCGAKSSRNCDKSCDIQANSEQMPKWNSKSVNRYFGKLRKFFSIHDYILSNSPNPWSLNVHSNFENWGKIIVSYWEYWKWWKNKDRAYHCLQSLIWSMFCFLRGRCFLPGMQSNPGRPIEHLCSSGSLQVGCSYCHGV